MLLFFVLIFSILLSGCGGGSSSGTPDTIANPAPEEDPVLENGPVPEVFSVSGTIKIPIGSLADNDSMKPSGELLVSNNSISTAQSIINPSATGGYVSSRTGTYQNRRFSYDADPVDFYSVFLLKNQVVPYLAECAYYLGDYEQVKIHAKEFPKQLGNVLSQIREYWLRENESA